MAPYAATYWKYYLIIEQPTLIGFKCIDGEAWVVKAIVWQVSNSHMK